jgi:hypothetical protein
VRVRELAVDFGTSNTVAAVRTHPGEPVRLLHVDGWPVLPSAVWLDPERRLVVGRDAERQARLDPARYEPNPKRRVDDGEVLLGDTVLPVVELFAAVLRRVAQEAGRHLGGPPDRVVLTHPAGWRSTRCEVLRTAARLAGWPQVELLPEPVAAAAHLATGPAAGVRPNQVIAVHDMGGGTTDAALVVRTDTGWRVLAEAGLPDVGGRDVDQALADHVRRVVGADRPEWAALLRPADPAGRRAARAFADDVRAAKEALSRYPQTDVPLPPPLPDAHVTRAELERLVRPALERTADLLAGAVAAAGVDRSRLAGVFLVGGATRMPLVARLVAERVGVLPVAVESPENAVVLGALTLPGQPAPAGPPTPPRPEPALSELTTRPVARPTQVLTVPPDVRASRRGVLVAVGVLLVAALVAVAITLLVNHDTTAGSSPPTTSTTTAAASVVSGEDGQYRTDKERLFADDPELRRFAGQAVDRALGCQDHRDNGGLGNIYGARTQVQCVYPAPSGDGRYYATFLSAAPGSTCQAALTILRLSLGQPVDSGDWSGAGRQGSWQDYTPPTGPVSAVTYWTDAGGTLCGDVEPEYGQRAAQDEVHQVWDTRIRPGS